MIKYKLSNDDSVFLAHLRSFAIFIIVFGHVGGFWFYRPYSEFLHASVPIFFFLSGAVSFFSYERSPSLFSYYSKKIVSLLVPYYLLCLLSLFVYVGTNRAFPSFDFSNLLSWLSIRASNSITPFPIGQVWFLRVLMYIIVLSPMYFLLNKHRNTLLKQLLLLFVSLSAVQLFFNIEPFFKILSVGLYRPFVFSSFFIYGIIFFTSFNLQQNRGILFFSALISLSLCVFLANRFELNIDFAYHTFPPDIFFVSGSFFAIFVLLMFRKKLSFFSQKLKFIDLWVQFFHKHTFSIFLLHTFAIYLSEKIFGLVEPQDKNLKYGITKLIVVLIITCTLSMPFTKMSNYLTSLTIGCLNKVGPNSLFKKHFGGHSGGSEGQ